MRRVSCPRCRRGREENGFRLDLVELVGKYCTIPVTYAGGARSIEDLELVKSRTKFP